jgi:PAS domain S-box-containing protein
VVVAYWGITGFGFRQSDSLQAATLWLRVGGLWPLTHGFLLHFILILTDRSSLLDNKMTYGMLYIPPLLLSILDTTTNLVTGNPIIGLWGWTIEAPQFSFFYYASMVWQVLVGIVALALCIGHWFTTTSFKKKKQIQYVSLGLSIPFIFSVIVETVEVVLQIPLPEVIMPGFALGSVFFGYAIIKYELFVLDPSTVAEDIVSLISEFLFLINLEGVLEMASESALRGLRYSKEELLGKKVDILFEKAQDIYLFRKKGLITLQNNPLSDYETYLKTKTGSLIPVSLSASAIQNKNGDNVGIICVARDITQRKQTEQALFESGRAFTLLFEGVPDPVYVWKQQDDGCIILEQVNRATVEQTEGKINDFIGKDLDTFYEYNQEIPERIKNTFKTGIISREPGTYHSSITGEEKWLLVDYVKISTDKVLIVAKDLTDKIQIERELKREKEFSESILEVVNALVVGVDNRGDIFLFNKTAETVTGYTKEEIIGRNWFKTFLPSRTESKVFLYLKTGKGPHPVHREGYILTKSGEKRFISWNNTLIKDNEGEVISVFAIGEDITEEKRSQQVIESLNKTTLKIQNLTDSDAILSAIGDELEKFGFAVFILDADEKTNTFSFVHVRAPRETALANRIFGMDILNHSIPLINKRIVRTVTKDYQPLYIDDITDLLVGAFEFDEEKVHDLQEKIGWKQLIIAPLITGKEIVRFFCVGSSFLSEDDVPAVMAFAHQTAAAIENAQLYEKLKQAHADLIDLTENLEKKVEMRTEELTQANQLKSEFLANISHELRTPLNAILSFSEILLMEMEGPLNMKQKEDLKMIKESGKDLLGLINGILDLSKIENEKMELHKEPVHIADMISSVVSQITLKAVEKGLTVKTEIPDSSIIVMGDELRLKQVVRNLIDNALKFTKKGSITVGFKKEKDFVVVSVQDTGIGIGKEDHHRIFDKFIQIEGGTTREFGGTGLGLSVTKEIIELHGGKIWVESELGEGSTFLFSLPIHG